MTEALDLPPPAAETDVLWFLPTHGDGRYLGSEIGARHVSLGYLSQIARAADELGYYGVLLPTGRSCEDSWVIASAMVPLTQRLRFPHSTTHEIRVGTTVSTSESSVRTRERPHTCTLAP